MESPLVRRMQPYASTIFDTMSELARTTGAINLGQGFPDTDGPQEVLDAAREAIATGHNQYPPGRGTPELRTAIARHQLDWYGIELDPDTDVVVTAGANEACTAAILAFCEAGDEVVMLEPAFDNYLAATALAGAVPVPVTLRHPDYRLDPDELRAAVTPRTRLLLVNSPHNPTGRVLDAEELQAVADVAIEHDLLVLTDEVYEHLTFDDHRHVPLASLPGMFERTVTLSSGGKTFHTTGWKTGWATGPQRLVDAVNAVKLWMTFTNGGPLQPAIAVGLGLPRSRFDQMRASLQAGRDALVPALQQLGLDVRPSQGSYFVMADISPVAPGRDGLDWCTELPHRCGVVGVPAQAFYLDPERGRTLVRFAFAKRPEVIADAAHRLSALAS